MQLAAKIRWRKLCCRWPVCLSGLLSCNLSHWASSQASIPTVGLNNMSTTNIFCQRHGCFDLFSFTIVRNSADDAPADEKPPAVFVFPILMVFILEVFVFFIGTSIFDTKRQNVLNSLLFRTLFCDVVYFTGPSYDCLKCLKGTHWQVFNRDLWKYKRIQPTVFKILFFQHFSLSLLWLFDHCFFSNLVSAWSLYSIDLLIGILVLYFGLDFLVNSGIHIKPSTVVRA